MTSEMTAHVSAVETVWVILPAFNEASELAGVLRGLSDTGYSSVVVDDGSSDDTAAIAEESATSVLRHPVNLGQGAALQTGMTWALRQGARYLVHLDADGQHRAQDIERLLEPLRQGVADVALGSRFLRREDRDRVPWPRRLVLRGGIAVNALLTGLWLSDAHNGLRALTREAAEKIRLRQAGFAHASEILDEIRSNALRIVEVPVTVTYTARSLAKGQRGWNALNILIDFVIQKVLR